MIPIIIGTGLSSNVSNSYGIILIIGWLQINGLIKDLNINLIINNIKYIVLVSKYLLVEKNIKEVSNNIANII